MNTTELIRSELLELGAPTNLSGFRVTISAIKLMIENKKYVTSTMLMYDKLDELEQFNSERSIRFMITKIYDTNKEFLQKFCHTEKCPSPSRFLTTLFYTIQAKMETENDA